MLLDTCYSNCYLQFRRPSAGVPPLPIPNREVKPCSADGTGVTPGRVGRRHIIEALRFTSKGFFCTKYFVQSTRYKVQSMEQHAGLDPTWYIVLGTWYLIQQSQVPQIINWIQVEHFHPALFVFVYAPEIRNWGCQSIMQVWWFASRIPSSTNGTQLFANSYRREV